MLNQRLTGIVAHAASDVVRQARDLLESLRDVALTGETIQRQDRRVALQAGSRLLALRHPLRLLLVEQGVEVPAPIAVVESERVPGEDPREPGIPIELLLCGPCIARPEAAPAISRRGRERGAAIGVVLEGPVLPPDGGIDRRLGHLRDSDEGLPSFLLALEDVRQQRQQDDGGASDGGKAEEHGEPGSPSAPVLCDGHDALLSSDPQPPAP